MAVIELDVQDFLPLGQGDSHNPTAYDLLQWLALSDAAKTQMILEAVQHLYSPQQIISLEISIRNLSVVDQLIFYQQGAKNAAVESLISTFFMWQEARLIEYEQVAQVLGLTQEVLVVAVKAAIDSFLITQTASCLIVKTIQVVQNLQLGSYAKAYKENVLYIAVNIPSVSGPNTPEC